MAFDDDKKNLGGRPLIYDNPTELAAQCEAYFAEIETEKKKPTITGLTYFLGFADKSTLYDYAKRDGFSHPIKRAILRIEMGYEDGLRDNNVAGTIFALKNMGWKDRSEVAPVTPDGEALGQPMINIQVVAPNLPDSENKVDGLKED